jgi:hypothetical protein
MDSDKPSGALLVSLGRRMAVLCDLTATIPADWQIEFRHRIGLESQVTATSASGAYITLIGGGPDSEEFLLDEKGLTSTARRRLMLTRGGFALGSLLIREHRKLKQDRITRSEKKGKS